MRNHNNKTNQTAVTKPLQRDWVDKAWECCQHTSLSLYIAADECNKNATGHPKHGRVLVTYKWEGNFNQWILVLLPLSRFRGSIDVCLDNPSRLSACENIKFLQLCLFLLLRAKHGDSKNIASALYFCDDLQKNPETATFDGLFHQHPANCFFSAGRSTYSFCKLFNMLRLKST